MTRFAGWVLALCSLCMATFANAAEYASPEGVWEIEFRDSHYRVEFCDGDKLCGTLIWLAPEASSPEKLAYLNQMLVKYARPTGANTWKGEMDLLGQHALGTIKQTGNDTLTLTGCKFVVLCRTFEMHRLPPGASPGDPR